MITTQRPDRSAREARYILEAHKRAGARLRTMRVDRGWTLEDMAAEIEALDLGINYTCSASTICRAERGDPVGTRRRFAMAAAFGTVPSTIWTVES